MTQCPLLLSFLFIFFWRGSFLFVCSCLFLKNREMQVRSGAMQPGKCRQRQVINKELQLQAPDCLQNYTPRKQKDHHHTVVCDRNLVGLSLPVGPTC